MSVLSKVLVPDMAMAAAILTFGFGLSLFDGPRKLFRDSDSGWHIRNGEAILQSLSLPVSDPYSFSRPSQPWVAWEWGADVLMAFAHKDGLAGVTLLYLAAIGLCTWLWFRLQWRLGGSFLLACAMASPMLSTANLHWLARPHVLGWALLLLSALWLEGLNRRKASSVAAVAFLLTAGWANIHASFFLLPLLAAIYGLGAWAERRLWIDPPARGPVSNYWIAVAAGLAGSFVTPYGLFLHRHVFQYLTNAELLQRIGEFQTFNFHSEGATQIVLTLALAAAGAVLSFTQRNIAHALILALFAAGALRSARALPVLALLLPYATAAFTNALADGAAASRAAEQIRAFLGYSANLRRLEAGFGGYVWAPLVLWAGCAILHTPAMAARTGFPPSEFPVAASEKVALLPSDARLLAPDKFGGYLIYRFSGTRKVFFDGRSDFYGIRFMRDYIDLVQVRPGWERILERHKFTHALLPRDYTLAAVLPRIGWTETFADPTAVLLKAP